MAYRHISTSSVSTHMKASKGKTHHIKAKTKSHPTGLNRWSYSWRSVPECFIKEELSSGTQPVCVCVCFMWVRRHLRKLKNHCLSKCLHSSTVTTVTNSPVGHLGFVFVPQSWLPRQHSLQWVYSLSRIFTSECSGQLWVWVRAAAGLWEVRDTEFVNLDAAVVNLSLTDVQMHNSEFLLKNGGINVNGQSASFKTSLKDTTTVTGLIHQNQNTLFSKEIMFSWDRSYNISDLNILLQKSLFIHRRHQHFNIDVTVPQ